MGRQVGFYMKGSDELDFIEFVRSDREVALFGDALPDRKVACLDELPGPQTPGWFQLWLWDVTNSPEPVLWFVAEQNHYAVDRFASEVIEFHRSTFRDGFLWAGRIWAEMRGWRMDNPLDTFRKSESFVRWFDRLARWVRRKSTRVFRGAHVLPGAQEFVSQGGALS
jgi:hypothetical protein